MVRLNIPHSLKDAAKKEATDCGGRLIWNSDEKRWFHGAASKDELPPGLQRFYGGVVVTSTTALAPDPHVAAGATAVAHDGSTEQFHVLALPRSPYFTDVAKAYGVIEDERWRVKYWYGDKRRLPGPLKGFDPKPYSYEQYVENLINARRAVVLPPTATVTLRPHQQAGVLEIYRAFTAGYPGFLLADEVGLGKTILGWSAVLQLYRTPINVAIIAPLSVHPGWRTTIERMGNGGHSVVVINYERLRYLYTEPEDMGSVHSERRRLKHIAHAGTPKPFSLLIFDESHMVKNLDSARTQLGVRLYREGTRVLWLSATAGQSPVELGYLLPILQTKTSGIIKPNFAPSNTDFVNWYKAAGVGVSRGQYGNWEMKGDDDERRLHCRHMAEILWTPDKNGVRMAIRRTPEDIAGWPSLQRIPWAVELDPDENRQYQTEWAQFLIEFRKEKDEAARATAAKHSATQPGSAAILRFRQKASLLRAKHTAEYAEELIASGQQVAISVQWGGTLDAIGAELTKRHIPYARITGRETGDSRELERKRYQTGEAKVVLFTIEAGISLHQGEDGGNNVPRSQIDHDIRYSAIQMHQVDGRSQRDGRFARSYWAYADGTREEGVALKLLDKLKGMKSMMGETEFKLEELEQAFIGDAAA